jgi:hypothetical protein
MTPHTTGQARPNSRPGGLAVSELLNPYGGGLGRFSADTEHSSLESGDRQAFVSVPGSSFALERQNPIPTRPLQSLRGPREAPPDYWSLYEQPPPWTMVNSHQYQSPRPQSLPVPRYPNQQPLPPSNHQPYQVLPVPLTVTQQALPPSNLHLRGLRQYLPRNFVTHLTESAPSNRQLHPLEPINFRPVTEATPHIVRRRGAYASPYSAYEGQGLQSKSRLVTGVWENWSLNSRLSHTEAQCFIINKIIQVLSDYLCQLHII